MKREQSGLARTCLEHAKFEARLGHTVSIREPSGALLFGPEVTPDLHTIHSQFAPESFHDHKPKIFVCHGEPLSSVANGISMRAVCDLAPIVDAFICMRREEAEIWSTIKRTYVVPKGVDEEIFYPMEGAIERLEGEPAVLIYENPRGSRNPLYPLIAMKLVWQKLPRARLHIFNMHDKKMHDTFSTLIKYAKLWPFVRTLSGPVAYDKVPLLLNRCDIVVSALYPLYARSLEALACGKAFISAGYNEPGYPWTVAEYSPEAFAETIIACWTDYQKVNYRQWALEHHSAAESSRQMCAIYEKYL